MDESRFRAQLRKFARPCRNSESTELEHNEDLARGKLHVEVFDDSLPGGTPQGAAELVAKVRSALNVRFQSAASRPHVVFTDRGRGFYAPNNGAITIEYKQALHEHGLQASMGAQL